MTRNLKGCFIQTANICNGFALLMTWILLRVPHTNNQDLQGLCPTNDLDLLRVPHTNNQDLQGVCPTNDLDLLGVPHRNSQDLQGVCPTNDLDFAKGASKKQRRFAKGLPY